MFYSVENKQYLLYLTCETFLAARCIQYYKVQLVATEDILLILGSNDLSHWATSGAVTRGASDVVVHPDFKNNPTSANADMALIVLSEYFFLVIFLILTLHKHISS